MFNEPLTFQAINGWNHFETMFYHIIAKHSSPSNCEVGPKQGWEPRCNTKNCSMVTCFLWVRMDGNNEQLCCSWYSNPLRVELCPFTVVRMHSLALDVTHNPLQSPLSFHKNNLLSQLVHSLFILCK